MRFFTPSEISLQLRRACARAGARTNAIRTGMIDETSNSLMELQEGGTHSTLMAFDFDLVGEWDWICPAFGKKGGSTFIEQKHKPAPRVIEEGGHPSFYLICQSA